jgi:hypothetical protein
MTTMVRHGGAFHVMRPDRVMRTSVLAPMVGYSPQADVMAVAQAFTQGPPLGTDLRGLDGVGVVDKIKAFFAQFRAKKAMKQAVKGMGASPGPINFEARDVAPQMQAQMAILRRLSMTSNARHMKPPLLYAARTLESRRPFTYYRAG